MSETDDQKLDLASVFPAKGDSRRPPDWWGRALLYTVIAVFAAIFVWTSWGKISTIVLDVVISIFIALASRWWSRWCDTAGSVAPRRR